MIVSTTTKTSQYKEYYKECIKLLEKWSKNERIFPNVCFLRLTLEDVSKKEFQDLFNSTLNTERFWLALENIETFYYQMMRKMFKNFPFLFKSHIKKIFT